MGWLVGLFIGSQLFAEKQKVEGPRLGDLQVQASTYGMGIPLVFGSMRLAGATDIEFEENQAEVGGKGFGPDGPGCHHRLLLRQLLQVQRGAFIRST